MSVGLNLVIFTLAIGICFWWGFRGLIKDGAIRTNTPTLFLLGKQYKEEK